VPTLLVTAHEQAPGDLPALFYRNGFDRYVGGLDPLAIAWTVAGLGIHCLVRRAAILMITIRIVARIGYYAAARVVAFVSLPSMPRRLPESGTRIPVLWVRSQ
jgi:hypothetical protein